MVDPQRPFISRIDEQPAVSHRLLSDLLRGVARTFYLTLRVLPGELRQPVGLAYLLARAADTIADTRLLAPPDRLKHLLAFRSHVEGQASGPAFEEIGRSLTDKQSNVHEKLLLSSLPQAFEALEGLSEPDRTRVRAIVVTLTRGMEMDLTRFAREDSGRVEALRDPDELETYIYYVAGCVGEFWTAITAQHTPSLSHWDVETMSAIGVRFGKALQLTNVLRDVPKDLRIGRCYLPETELARVGLAPEELLDHSVGTRARPVLYWGIEAALENYRAAEQYILAVPRRCVRLRLAVLWPVLIGLATLGELARNEGWLDPRSPSKVSRSWVYSMMPRSILCAVSSAAARIWIGRLRRRVEEAIR